MNELVKQANQLLIDINSAQLEKKAFPLKSDSALGTAGVVGTRALTEGLIPSLAISGIERYNRPNRMSEAQRKKRKAEYLKKRVITHALLTALAGGAVGSTIGGGPAETIGGVLGGALAGGAAGGGLSYLTEKYLVGDA